MRAASTGPSRTGVLAALAGAATVGVGRFFGVLELYVIGAAAMALVVVALVWVTLARLSPRVERQVRPDRVHAGTAAHVALELSARHRTPELTLFEPVEHTAGAVIGVAPMRRGEHVRATYRLPTQRRGLLSVGPLRATVTDPFGLASRQRVVSPTTGILVYPRLDPLWPPRIGGAGPLGTHLARQALATAAGAEFHSQRSYVAGDDLRRVNWRASARTNDLIVRETTHDGRVLIHVVLDLVVEPDGDDEAFERAVSAAASVAVSAAERDLPLRFELTDGTWFRGGAETLPLILEHLALVAPTARETPAGGRADHDLLSVAVLVSADANRRSAALRARVASATAATVVVGTGDNSTTNAGSAGWFVVDAADPATFVQRWNVLVGEHRRARAS